MTCSLKLRGFFLVEARWKFRWPMIFKKYFLKIIGSHTLPCVLVNFKWEYSSIAFVSNRPFQLYDPLLLHTFSRSDFVINISKIGDIQKCWSYLDMHSIKNNTFTLLAIVHSNYMTRYYTHFSDQISLLIYPKLEIFWNVDLILIYTPSKIIPSLFPFNVSFSLLLKLKQCSTTGSFETVSLFKQLIRGLNQCFKEN